MRPSFRLNASRPLAVVLAVIVAVLATALTVRTPVHAATTPLSAYKILSKTDSVAMPNGTVWATNTLEINYTGGQGWLSSNPDGSGSTLVHDLLGITLGDNGSGGDMYFSYGDNDRCPAVANEPILLDVPKLPSNPFVPGVNKLTVTAANRCDTTTGAATDVWLVFLPSGTTPDPTPTPTPPPASCASVSFIGVRGSGETEGDFGGLGSTIQNVANTFSSRVPLAKILHVDYPAVRVGYGGIYYRSIYDSSVDAGRIQLKTKIKQILRECPGTGLVLAGYSQGAHVVGDVLDQLTSAQRKKVVAAVLIGDPRFNHKQKQGVNVGDFGPFNGIYSLKQKPRSITGQLADRVHSYCTGGDPVCNFYLPYVVSCEVNGGETTGLCPHILYEERGWADKAGLWAAARYRSP